jgi:hypothetical protein
VQDIDFDELDRAVSSASAPSPTPADETPSDAIAVTNRSTPRPDATPAPAARRSSGRFMDVVHPSSDMRTSSNEPERSVPRESEDEKSEERSVERTSDWPDPLDFHGFNADEPEKTEEAPTPEPALVEPEPPQPLESPFLSDTKVEKRPLGAFSTTETPAANEPDTLLLEAPDEELLTAKTEEKVEEAPTPEPVIEEAVEEGTPQPVIEPTPEPTPIQEAPQGPTSITQQYKEQPSTADQPSGAIYDTETYHQPLTHTPKKKSGALVIVWILALILVGAGAGAAVYFFVLPML